MAGRPKRDGHGRPRIELRLRLPGLEVRRQATGARPPAPGSASGSTGMPKHNFRCPNDVWGAAVQAAAARGLEWGPVLRGYTAAFVRGEAPVFPDPVGPGTADDPVS